MRILIATDGATHSNLAVHSGGYLHQAVGGTIAILTVVKHEKDRRRGEEILSRAAELLAPIVKEPETRIRVGRTDVEILSEATVGKYDLLVVGEGPQDVITRHLLGPKVKRIVSHKPCPILIARSYSRPVKKLLLCEGGRDPSLLKRMIDHLPKLLQSVRDLTILHVMSQITAAPGLPDWELETDAKTLISQRTYEGLLLAHDLDLLQKLNVHLEAKVRHGLVVPEILDEADSGDYDLIVIGAHQSHGWQRFLLDDLAMDIINQGKQPLLVI